MAVPRLNDIQAVILKPHGREYVLCIFLEFQGDETQLKKQISDLVYQNELTSAKGQNEEAANYKAALAKKEEYIGGVLACLFLTYRGYQALELIDQAPKDFYFRSGMSNPDVSRGKNDPQIEHWHKDFKKENVEKIHAMILLASDSEVDLQSKKEGLLNKITAEIVHEEFGQKRYGIFNGKKYPIEPFGFRDGVSNPQFFEKDDRTKLLEKRWRIVLDDLAGSYLVFRRLEQDVKGFNNCIEKLSQQLGISKEKAEAQVIGRFTNSTPLTLYEDLLLEPDSDERVKLFNNYYLDKHKNGEGIGYEEDEHGNELDNKCPFHAHIRKTNPRNQTLVEGYDDKDLIPRRIARRSIPYVKIENEKKKEGILFMCFQRNISEHFEHIQIAWSNEKDFPNSNLDPGTDPLIGQIESGTSNQQYWNKKWGEEDKHPFDFRDFVTFQGGEYFYAPSLSFLKSLGD